MKSFVKFLDTRLQRHKGVSDIIANQSGYSMPMYCINSAGEADDLPLKFDGTLK
jgi:predicted butyrate kinase (DUF1464 family)